MKLKWESTHKLKPKCFEDMDMAVDNQGRLLPCCYCDTVKTRNDPEYQKLMKVSYIKDYKDVKEILMTEEWISFKDNLLNNAGPPACLETCKLKKETGDFRKKETYTLPEGGEVKRIV